MTYRTGKADDEVNFDPDSVLDMMKTMLNSTDRERPASPDNSRDRDEDNFSVSEESSDEDEEMADRGGEMEEMEEIMEEMDREISVTEVGKSFEKMKVKEKEILFSIDNSNLIYFVGFIR